MTSIKSDLHIHTITKEDGRIWNDFIENNPYSTPYHLWEFGRALSSTYGYKRHYFVARKNDEIIGVFPLIHIGGRLFGSKLLSLPFCEYGGPLISSNYSDSVQVVATLFEAVLTLASSLNVDYVEIRNPLFHGELLEKEGCHVVRRYITFEVDLSREKKHLWRSLDKKTRNSTQKAMKNNLTLYEVSKENELKEYFSLYLKTQKKHGSPPHDFELFRNLWLDHRKSVKMFIAEHRVKPIAGIIVFCDKRRIYWWGGASDPKFRHLNATNLLLWKTIAWGHENNAAYLNLGRTRYRTGVYHFKKGWGGMETPLVDYIYAIKGKDAITPDPSDAKYWLLSKLWSHFPIFLGKLLGPKIVKQMGL